MWITQKIAQPSREGPAENGRAEFLQEGAFYAAGSGRQQNAPLYAPAGIASIPVQGAQVMLLPCGGETVCTGVRIVDLQGLSPGEIRLFSAGGASLTLKNSGEIELNGVTIARDGTLYARRLAEREGG